jgi:DnaK suppressor protein
MTDHTTRDADLRAILDERRREIEHDVQSRIRSARTDRSIDVRDDVEQSDDGIQGDIERALLQMRAETLTRIDEALVRLDAGQYGSCVDCEKDIAGRRLRALPFAVRCQACAEKRESQHGRTRRPQTNVLSLFPEAAGS